MKYSESAQLAYMAWCEQYQDASCREGWSIMDCDGSSFAPFQLQKFDDPEMASISCGFDIPYLDSDEDAWSIVANGSQPHHVAALAFLRDFAHKEYIQIEGLKNASN